MPRRNFFIDKNFQSKFIVKFCAIVIISSFIIGVILFYSSRGFTTVTMEGSSVIVKRTSDIILPIVVQTLVLVTLFSAVWVTLLTLFTSHKIAGPLYRLKKEIDNLKNGKLNVSFRTRRSDQLQNLSRSLSEMGEALDRKHLELKRKLAELKACLDKAALDKDVVSKKIGELEEILSYFKI